VKTAIILHGRPDKEEFYDPKIDHTSNSHWLPWLQKQLLIKDVFAQTPELPKPYYPSYEDWKGVFEGHKIDNQSLLVGHSCGGGFLLRWVSENKDFKGRLVLVAPWINPENKDTTELGFFDFEIDNKLTARLESLDIFYSTDDMDSITKSIDIIKQTLPSAIYHKFTDKGHFDIDALGTKEFPELLEVCLE